jgi:hypothetical protein
MNVLPFTIEGTTDSTGEVFLVLISIHGASTPLDGKGSLHGQVVRAIKELSTGMAIAAVDDFLGEPEAEQDYARWERERGDE